MSIETILKEKIGQQITVWLFNAIYNTKTAQQEFLPIKDTFCIILPYSGMVISEFHKKVTAKIIDVEEEDNGAVYLEDLDEWFNFVVLIDDKKHKVRIPKN